MSIPGGMEWVVIILVILLLFGAKKIPDLARGLGEGIREFKKATREAEKEPPSSQTGKQEPKAKE